MAGLVVQHNMSAINANNKMNTNVAGLKKATEKLSSGYQINRAGDNAAGLAISEKMRSQIRGLAQATRNANDGISLIQTAEGGLNETHSILQRMRELAVQSANGTYQDDTDREAIQLEVDALKSEIDRISTATEYNGMKLLDGSLGGSSNTTNNYGATYGMVENVAALSDTQVTTTSNIAGVSVSIVADATKDDETAGASGKGGENAVWSQDGKTVTINLVGGRSYTDDEINDLIKNATIPKDAGTTGAAAQLTWKTDNGVIKAATATTTATVAGVRQTSVASDGTEAGDLSGIVADKTNGGMGSSDTIRLTANTYGESKYSEAMFAKITIVADVAAGKEDVQVVDENGDAKPTVIGTSGAEITLHLATGVDYTEKDIENILKKGGYDYSVKLTDATTPDGANDGTIKFNISNTPITIDLDTDGTAGVGVGKEFTNGSGEGLTFQIGANGVEDQRVTLNVDDMSSSALGVANADVSTRDAANKAIEMVDSAVKKVSMQRAGLGALQNRLEYTVNNLTTTNENLTNAESQIRDTDMATEMINYTKYNILQQASQAMLAQANQQPQAVLQLLG